MDGCLAFEFYRLRFHFRALEPIRFPAGKAANSVRGALGEWDRGRNPPNEPNFSPSGFSRPPRPLVLRASHLDGASLEPGADFCLDVHDFAVCDPELERLRAAFSDFAGTGIGPGRGRASLVRVEKLDLDECALRLDDPPNVIYLEQTEPASHVQIRFATPTELKAGGSLAERPEFPVLFARIRDRVSTLRALYGRGPLEIDYQALGARARDVRVTRCELTWERATRRSSRTGQVHSIGGFIGVMEFEGQLGEFLPWLRAARWTGVGRQTVWGKGDLRVISYSA